MVKHIDLIEVEADIPLYWTVKSCHLAPLLPKLSLNLGTDSSVNIDACINIALIYLT